MQFSIVSFFGKQALKLDVDHTRLANDNGLFTSPTNPFKKWYFSTFTSNAAIPAWDNVNVNLTPFQSKSVLFSWRPYAQANPTEDILPIAQVGTLEKLVSVLMFGNPRTGQYQYIAPNSQGISQFELSAAAQSWVPVPSLVTGCIPFDLRDSDNLDVAVIVVDGKQDGAGTELGIGSLIFVQDQLPAFYQTTFGGRMYTT